MKFIYLFLINLLFSKAFIKLNRFNKRVIYMNNNIATTKVLIHDAYGVFQESFSEKFKEEYFINNGIFFEELDIYDPFLDKNHQNKNIESRYDSKLVNIFEKLGSKKSSLTIDNDCEFIKAIEIPTELLNYINIVEEEGAESIFINISKIYKEVLFYIVKNNYIISDDIKNKIELIKKQENYLIENNIDYI
jgi:hypothetical protein